MPPGDPISLDAVAIQEEYLRSGSSDRAQILTLTDEEIVATDRSTQSVVEQLRTTFDGRWQQFDAILDDPAAGRTGPVARPRGVGGPR